MTNGVLLALLGYGIYAWGDGLIKFLGGHLAVVEIGLFSTVFASVFLFVFKPAGENWHGFWRMQRPWAVHVRAIAGVVAGPLGIYAFSTIPMAEVYAIFFLSPLFVTLFSVILLGEKVGPWRWTAIITGFIGILLVVRPGFRELELGHLSALCVSMLSAITIVLMRSLAGEKQTTMLGVLTVYGLLAYAAAGATMGVSIPDWQSLGVLVLVGASAACGHRLLLLATRLSPANHIAPTHYSQMIWAVLIGAAFFAEYPDWISIAGLLVVVASGLLTLVREQIRLGTVKRGRFFRVRL